MSIPLSQLDTWTHQGAVTSSAAAYASIRHALTKAGSALADRTLDIFLQGSYGNDTNIYGDSDVDVVVLFENTFHKDLSALTPAEQQLHERTFPVATYTWNHLRDDVLSALRSHYGVGAVSVGNKSISVQTGRVGRPSDVIPAVQFRRYASFPDKDTFRAHWGIQFFDSSGHAIVNYPKYHIDRGVAKNQAARTGGQYKSVIRLFKNYRNYMVDHGLLADGVAPSYFIECALHNVPDQLFRGALDDAVPAIIDHLFQAPFSALMCQNGVTTLIGDTSTQWSEDAFTAFLVAARDASENW